MFLYAGYYCTSHELFLTYKALRTSIGIILFVLQDELFDKARGEILDEVLSLSQLKPREWEDAIYKNLWDKLSSYAFENIYLPSAQTNNPVTFRTQIDILLKQWVERSLPAYGVEVNPFGSYQVRPFFFVQSI